jgi:hypothetical protein
MMATVAWCEGPKPMIEASIEPPHPHSLFPVRNGALARRHLATAEAHGQVICGMLAVRRCRT